MDAEFVCEEDLPAESTADSGAVCPLEGYAFVNASVEYVSPRRKNPILRAEVENVVRPACFDRAAYSPAFFLVIFLHSPDRSFGLWAAEDRAVLPFGAFGWEQVE